MNDDVIDIVTPGEWFDLVFGRCTAGWISLFSIEKNTGQRHVDWAPVTERAILADAAESRAATCDVWYGVATRAERLDDGKRGGSADCLELPGLFADLDVAGPNHKCNDALPKTIGEAKELLADFPVAPTAIVYSGGGIQPYWLFDEPVPAEEARRVLVRWAYTWGQLAAKRDLHIDNVFDLARVLRVPGTWNRKCER